MRPPKLEILAVAGIPEVHAGDDLAALLAGTAAFEDGDVVVVAQKIVSKAEGRVVETSKEAALATETARVVARRGDVLITETAHGFVCANAGIDESNTEDGTVVLLPLDPDASAERIRAGLAAATGRRVGVVVSDTFGRAWRVGQTNVALGVAGLAALDDLRGGRDRAGRELSSTVIAVADEIAGAAELVMGKTEGVPVAIVRGWPLGTPGTGRDLLRPPAEDLFPTGIGGTAPGPPAVPVVNPGPHRSNP